MADNQAKPKAGTYIIKVNEEGDIEKITFTQEEIEMPGVKGEPMDYEELPDDLRHGPALGDIYYSRTAENGRCVRLPSGAWR